MTVRGKYMNELKRIKTHGILWTIAYLVILVFIIYIIFLSIKGKQYSSTIEKYDYITAKTETIKYLGNSINSLESRCNMVLENKPEKCVTYDELAYCYNDVDGKENIEIGINSQGFLGGQYWGLIYSKDDLLDGEDISIEKSNSGNNILIKQKIQNNWYFHYYDYDGQVNTDDIK